jgi:HSP20 family protein
MAMEPWNPFREMTSLRDAMDRLFQESFVRPTGALLGRGSIPLDVSETDHDIEVTATMPGVDPNDVQVTVQGDTLVIRGETRREQEHRDRNYLTRERHVGTYYRSITLPAPVNADKADARFENGVLRLTLPKAEEAKPRQIKIGGRSQSQQIPTQEQQH